MKTEVRKLSICETDTTKTRMREAEATKTKVRETKTALRARAQQIYQLLAELYPDAHCELDFENPLQLLVATILSAQSTDRRVNAVSVALFAKYRCAADYAAADRQELEQIIYPTGFFRNKTDSLIKLGAALVADHAGCVPGTMEELVKLPGVGRKTANVVLNEAFGVPGLTTDTHFIRLTNRFAWVQTNDPAKVEIQVGKLFDPSQYNLLNHRLIWHGRRRCHARRPACGACSLAQLCPAFGEGETDPKIAAGLIREPRR